MFFTLTFHLIQSSSLHEEFFVVVQGPLRLECMVSIYRPCSEAMLTVWRHLNRVFKISSGEQIYPVILNYSKAKKLLPVSQFDWLRSTSYMRWEYNRSTTTIQMDVRVYLHFPMAQNNNYLLELFIDDVTCYNALEDFKSAVCYLVACSICFVTP